MIKLYGGLGNQLFQYAAGRLLASLRGTELVLDLAWYRHAPARGTVRSYELWRFPVAARPATKREALLCWLHNGRFVGRLPLLPRAWRHFPERGFEYHADLIELPDDTYLDGYWQSYKYLEPIADVLRRDLTPSTPPGPEDSQVARLIESGGAVSVHVRRGDYVSSSVAASYHGVCPIEYYEKAFELVSERISSPRFFVFSDDLEWARQNLPAKYDLTFVSHNTGESALQDLRLMSLCCSHVIANSSFSWWAAWLNPLPSKLVIAPARWFADGRPLPDLMPSDWIRL